MPKSPVKAAARPLPDENDTIIVAIIQGPFGESRQTSAAMRRSEAAATITDYLGPDGKLPKGEGHTFLKSLRLATIRSGN